MQHPEETWLGKLL